MIRRLSILVPAAALVLAAAAPQAATPPAAVPAAPHAVPPAEAPAAPAKPVDPVGRVAPATPNDLELRSGTLVLVTDAQSGRPYWVFSYTVANKTGRTQRFSPRFELITGEGLVLTAGNDVPPEAQRRLQRALGKMEAADQFQIMGDILEGEANAREGFAMWPAASGDTKELTLFVTGVSRATDTRTDAATGKTVTLRRTLQRRYSLPGETDPRMLAEVPLVSESWLMR